MDFSSDLDSPPSSPPSSPLMSAIDHNSLRFSNDSKLPQLTPLSSKEDEYAISSDSDIASLGRSEFLIRSPQRRNRLDSGLSSNSSIGGSRDDPQVPRTPKSKKLSSPRSNSRSRSRSKRRMSKNKEELVPAANIFKNLLIMEESLRQQVAAQRSLRNNYMLFLTILSFLLGTSTYNLYFVMEKPTGFQKLTHQFVAIIVLVTLFLYYISGEYRRTIVLPRKFLASTNKGLRQLNVRLTKVKTPFSERLIDTIRYLLHLFAVLLQMLLNWTGPILKLKVGVKCQQIISALENRSQPRVGATEVKLVLNPRIFSTNIRENWEMYRNEFWAREGARRRGEKIGSSLQEDRRELIDRDKKERKERMRSKISN